MRRTRITSRDRKYQWRGKIIVLQGSPQKLITSDDPHTDILFYGIIGVIGTLISIYKFRV